jgi:hypothetical protein
MSTRTQKLHLMRGLRENGFALTFADRWVFDYTCAQLKNLIFLFQLEELPMRTPSKLQLCAHLLRGKPIPNRAEENAAHAILEGQSLRQASLILHYAWPEPVPEPQAPIVEESTIAIPGSYEPRYQWPPAASRPCSACLDDVPQSEFPAISVDAQCLHYDNNLCTACLTSYIASQAESFALDAIPCPESGCLAHISYLMMQENAPVQLFERYQESINARAIGLASDFLECSNPVCQSGGIVDRDAMTYMTCNDCSVSTCLSCRTLWHPRMSHEENMEALRAAAEAANNRGEDAKHERRTIQYLRRNSKPCPQCGVAISKNSGCDHMTW